MFTISQKKVLISAARPVRIQELPAQRDIGDHDHDYHEIFVVMSGKVWHRTETDAGWLSKGSVAVVPPGKTHAFERTENFSLINIYYLAEWLLSDFRSIWEQEGLMPLFFGTNLFSKPLLAGIPVFELSSVELKLCAGELKTMLGELARKKPSTLFLKSSLLKVLIFLSRAFLRRHSAHPDGSFRKEFWLVLDQVERVLDEGKMLSVKEVAVKCGFSEDHLTRVFKEEGGLPIMEYYQKRRVQRACTGLLNPLRSITEIAYELGYADGAHFHRHFLKWQKMSPRQYRKTYLRSESSDQNR